jgi:hypothetical protein
MRTSDKISASDFSTAASQLTVTSGAEAMAMMMNDKQIAAIKRDLRTYMTGCQKQTEMFFQMTRFMTNPSLTECDDDLVREWGKKAMREVWTYLRHYRKRIDGKDWNVGFLGSVWKDTVLSGRMTRICYYSRKMNAETIKGISDPEIKYVIMLDPQDVSGFQ